MDVNIEGGMNGAPSWFGAALDAPVATGWIHVRGVRISYRAWGVPGAPGVILVHGTAAHARWWDHIAPQLSVGRYVVAIDLSGHGDSEWRTSYSQEIWAEELRAVVREITQPEPIVVAHSMGGKVAFRAAADGMDREVRAIVFLDSNFARPLAPDRAAAVHARSLKARRVFSNIDAVVDGFRPIGLNLPLPRYLAEYVGVHSAEQVSGGWSWKFDTGVFVASAQDPPHLVRLHCPTRVLRAGIGSVIDEPSVEQISSGLGSSTFVHTLPDSGHHMMFDAPAALVSTLQRYRSRW